MNPTPIDHSGAARGSLKTYAAGFVLAVVLTLLAFGLVMGGGLSATTAAIAVYAAAVAQILVHLHFFLHLDTSSAMRWNLMALLFTALIIFLFVGGTVWIMAHLQARLM